MDTSIEMSLFLAKVIGVYFLILALLCYFRHQEMKMTGKEVLTSRSALAVSAELSLIFGLLIVFDHNVWENSWRVVITLIGYIMILRGVLRFAFQAHVKKMRTKLLEKGCGWLNFIMLALGAYLTYCGFVNP